MGMDLSHWGSPTAGETFFGMDNGFVASAPFITMQLRTTKMVRKVVRN
jgi:hypothetical protein